MSMVKNEYDDVRVVWVVLGLIAAVPLFITIISIPFGILGYHAEKSACAAYAEQTDRVTKFVDDAPYWWSCQVKTSSGWIDYDNLKQVETPNVNIETK